MKEIKLNIILGIILIIAFNAKAQEEKWEKPAGSIENAQVVIEKDKVISLRPVSRRFTSVQITPPKAQQLTIAYQLGNTVDTLSTLQVIVRPKTMRDQPLDKLYGLTAKLGYGNYKSPFILLDAGNKRNDEYMYNLNFNHFSSGKGAVNDAPYYSTRIGLDGKLYFNNIILSSALGFHNQNYRMYGYDPQEYANITDQEYLKQKLNVLSFNIGLVDNNLKNSSDQSFVAGLNLLSNNHFDKEFMLDFDYLLKWDMANDWNFILPVEYSLLNQNKTSLTEITRHYAGIKPEINYQWDSFTFIVGANGYFQKDPADQLDSKFLIYPNLGVIYSLNDKHALNLRINGEVEQISVNDLYNENLYLDSLQLANNNIKDFMASANIAGKVSESFGYRLEYQFAHYKRMMFYDNNPTDTARFNLVYDNSGAKLHSFGGGVNYLKNENVKFNLGARYNFYTTVDIEEAWHKPEFEINFSTQLRFFNKLSANLYYNVYTGIMAKDSNGLIKVLDPVNDFNLGLDLELTETAGLFLDFRNIIGQNYQIYNNYPVNGFQILGGISLRF